MYSQNNEEKIVSDYFGSAQGRFLDIGAFDGVTYSNTYRLVRSGWSGVAVEASPTVFQRLTATLRESPVQCLNECVTATEGPELTFWDNSEAYATTDQNQLVKWPFTTFNPIQVKPISIEQLLIYVGIDFDLVSIDVEGQSAELFHAAYRMIPHCRIWIVEHDGQAERIAEFATDHTVIGLNQENIILAK